MGAMRVQRVEHKSCSDLPVARGSLALRPLEDGSAVIVRLPDLSVACFWVHILATLSIV